MSGGKFATAVNCMDGRVQEPVMKFLKEKYKVDYVDMVTEPGPIKILDEKTNGGLVESIKARLKVSTGAHGSKLVAVVGHYDCAGNPVDRETQFMQTASSIELIKTWGFDCELIGLWVDETWTAEKVI